MAKRLSTPEKVRISEVAAYRLTQTIISGNALSSMNVYNSICTSLRAARPDCWDDSANEPLLSREQLDCLTTRTTSAVKTQLRQAMQRGEWSPKQRQEGV